MFFGPASLTAPFIEYSDYIKFIELKGVYAKLPGGTASWMPALKRGLDTVICIGIWMVVTEGFGMDPMHAGEDSFVNEGTWLWRVWFVLVTGYAKRCFFYFSWCIVDVATIASGLSFNGLDSDGNMKWDRVKGVNIYDMEFTPSLVAKTRGWNHQVHIWLKHYVGERLAKPGEKLTQGNEILTFLISAWWHGFHPFYTVLFFAHALLNTVNKEVYRARAFFTGVPFPGVIANLFNCFFMSFNMIAFTLLTRERCVNFTLATYGIHWILPPITLVLFKVFGLK